MTNTGSSLPRRALGWALRGLAAAAGLLLALLLVGFGWEQLASGRFADRFPAPGQLVPLPDGRQLHMVVQGEGDPTVVLVSGAGGDHTDWAPVVDQLAEGTRVIAYDRPGYGWSDPSPTMDAEAVTGDLHAALRALEVSGPIVLVGHSLGGIFIRHYRALHPEQVAGLVFVDSSHEEQMERLPQEIRETMETMQAAMNAVGFVSRFGVLRMADASGLVPEGTLPLPPADAPEATRQKALRSSVFRAMVREGQSITAALEQSAAVGSALGDLPLVVLSATEPPPLPPDLAHHAEEMQTGWAAMQEELAALSVNVRHLSPDGAGHYIQFDRPEIVIGEILGMVEAIRADTLLAPVDASRLSEPGAQR